MAATAQTDDLGEYRLGGLPAGSLIVSVNAGPGLIGPDGSPIRLGGISLTTTVNGRAVTEPSDSLLTRIYYPGVTSVGESQVVALSAGEERTSTRSTHCLVDMPAEPWECPSRVLSDDLRW